jgi:hypothetical protein
MNIKLNAKKNDFIMKYKYISNSFFIDMSKKISIFNLPLICKPLMYTLSCFHPVQCLNMHGSFQLNFFLMYHKKFNVSTNL